jgi:hypothetical protein
MLMCVIFFVNIILGLQASLERKARFAPETKCVVLSIFMEMENVLPNAADISQGHMTSEQVVLGMTPTPTRSSKRIFPPKNYVMTNFTK